MLRGHSVCLAMGRRGTPRKLGVPGEEASKVAYGIVDAGGYVDRHVLVVGGGDSAVEAALALAGSGGNRVTLSYRRKALFRLKARNEARLKDGLEKGQLQVLFESDVLGITARDVELRVRDKQGEASSIKIPNDEVFVLAGGIPPFKQLESAGVSFDPAKRPKVVTSEDVNGLFYALGGALLGTLIALLWTFTFREYYTLASELRPAHDWHGWLSPTGRIGLSLGICSFGLVLVNLLYLLRKSSRFPLRFGTLQAWMTGHVGTGVLALVFALMHGAMAPRETVGGHALLGLAVLIVTGGIGRYFYSFVPHAANGRDLELSEVQSRLTGLAAEWDREHRGFGIRIQAEVDQLVQSGHWRRSLPRRILALLKARHDLRETRSRLEKEARAEGLPEDQIRSLLTIASRAQRTALAAAHFEDLRGLLASWRYLHRWTALLMLLLVGVHIYTAIRYGGVFLN
jgi:dihydropyrimidine dehydrogenase (NAD+) subunit PreT